MTDKNIQIKIKAENGDIFVDMADDPKNPCKTCGACCTQYRISFYQAECTDNGGVVPSELVTPITPFYIAMKGTESGGRCIALQGEIGKDIGCAIYSNRPTVCRTFPVWESDGTPNVRCQESRQRVGLKPLKSLHEIEGF